MTVARVEYSSGHVAVLVPHPRAGRGYLIDEKIAPLVRALWDAGIETSVSCEAESTGRVQIGFAPGHGERFLSIAAGQFDPDPASLYGRVAAAHPRRVDEPADTWLVDLLLEDLGARHEWHPETRTWTAECLGPAEFTSELLVRFPPSDLSEVVARVHRAAVTG